MLGFDYSTHEFSTLSILARTCHLSLQLPNEGVASSKSGPKRKYKESIVQLYPCFCQQNFLPLSKVLTNGHVIWRALPCGPACLQKQSRDVPCVDYVIMMHTRHKHPSTARKVKRFPFHIEKLQKLDASQVFKRVQIQHQS